MEGLLLQSMAFHLFFRQRKIASAIFVKPNFLNWRTVCSIRE